MTWISETASLIKTPCTVLVMEKNMAKYNQIIETKWKFRWPSVIVVTWISETANVIKILCIVLVIEKNATKNNQRKKITLKTKNNQRKKTTLKANVYSIKRSIPIRRKQY